MFSKQLNMKTKVVAWIYFSDHGPRTNVIPVFPSTSSSPLTKVDPRLAAVETWTAWLYVNMYEKACNKDVAGGYSPSVSRAAWRCIIPELRHNARQRLQRVSSNVFNILTLLLKRGSGKQRGILLHQLGLHTEEILCIKRYIRKKITMSAKGFQEKVKWGRSNLEAKPERISMMARI